MLALTDRKMDHFEVGEMATAAVAVMAPPYDEALIALAGHPPFAIARPGEAAELVDVRPGLPQLPLRSADPNIPPGARAPSRKVTYHVLITRERAIQ